MDRFKMNVGGNSNKSGVWTDSTLDTSRSWVPLALSRRLHSPAQAFRPVLQDILKPIRVFHGIILCKGVDKECQTKCVGGRVRAARRRRRARPPSAALSSAPYLHTRTLRPAASKNSLPPAQGGAAGRGRRTSAGAGAFEKTRPGFEIPTANLAHFQHQAAVLQNLGQKTTHQQRHFPWAARLHVPRQAPDMSQPLPAPLRPCPARGPALQNGLHHEQCRAVGVFPRLEQGQLPHCQIRWRARDAGPCNSCVFALAAEPGAHSHLRPSGLGLELRDACLQFSLPSLAFLRQASRWCVGLLIPPLQNPRRGLLAVYPTRTLRSKDLHCAWAFRVALRQTCHTHTASTGVAAASSCGVWGQTPDDLRRFVHACINFYTQEHWTHSGAQRAHHAPSAPRVRGCSNSGAPDVLGRL